jgi:hypothetical protein
MKRAATCAALPLSATTGYRAIGPANRVTSSNAAVYGEPQVKKGAPPGKQVVRAPSLGRLEALGDDWLTRMDECSRRIKAGHDQNSDKFSIRCRIERQEESGFVGME